MCKRLRSRAALRLVLVAVLPLGCRETPSPRRESSSADPAVAADETREAKPVGNDMLLRIASEKLSENWPSRDTTGDADITVTVLADGSMWVDDEQYSYEALQGLLTSKAAESQKDAEGLPVLSVRIVGHRDTEYKVVEQIMIACMKSLIWRLSFGSLPDQENHQREDREF